MTAAHGAGETWVTVSGDYVYNRNTGDILQFEYWDADASMWNIIGSAFGADTAGAPTDNFCGGTSEVYTTDVLNIAAFTPTQLSGFKYRIYFDDTVGGAGWEWGFCFQSPTIVSATPPSCPDPITLTATNIDGFSADLGWTEVGGAVLWNIELVDITAAGTVTGTATSTGVANPFNLTGLTASNNYEYYVQADCGVDGTSAWIGPFAFSTTVACPDPSALTATNITATTADLGWTAGASETLWDVELGAQGFAATGTPTATGVANPYNATALTANTAYDFYVRADCNPNGTSAWVGPFTFSTACTTFTAPYTQDFENAGAIPVCWNQGASNSENWLFADGSTAEPGHGGNLGAIVDHTSGAGYFAWINDSAAHNTGTTLESPFVDVSGLTMPALSFWINSNNEGFTNVDFSVDFYDGAAWNTAVYTSNTNTGGWAQVIIDLSAYTITGPVQARFIVDENNGTDFYDDIALDDVAFDELPACVPPSAASASNVATTSADIGWTENNGSTAWEIVVQAAGTGEPAGAGTATATNPYSATVLTASTAYEAYVRTDCGGGTFSAWTGPINFTTLTPPPANNDCANAIALTPGAVFTTNPVVGTNAGATDSGELAPGCAFYSGGDVWYSAVVPADGVLTLEVNPEAGGLGDTGGAVYSGTCGALVLVGCNDDGSVSGAHPIININDPALANQTVYFRVWEYNNDAVGEFQVSAYSATLSVESAEVRDYVHYVDTVNNDFVVKSQSNISVIEVYNVVGQLINKIKPNSTLGKVNLNSINSGVYFAKILLENGRSSSVKFGK